MNLSGDKELIEALRILGGGLPTRVVDSSISNAMKPMLNSVVDKAREHRQPGPRPSGGHLDEGIVFRRKGGNKKQRSYVLGAARRARRILHLLEFGVRPHLQPRRGIIHPGHKAFPMMRPAFDEHAEQVPERFGIGIWHAISAMASVLNRRRK